VIEPRLTRYLASPPRADARVRLFCFPYAGGGATAFYPWLRLAPPWLQVLPVHLPGRENRHAEPPFTLMEALVADLARELRPNLDDSFAFFGHSLGALIAFELTLALDRAPSHLFVSASRPPHLPRKTAALSQLPDADFLAAIQRRYQALPPAVVADAEMLQLFLPPLRADFTLFDTYAGSQSRQVSCPISAFGGEKDPEVSPEELSAWEQQTCSTFRARVFPGGHFYLRDQQSQVVTEIAATLDR
jgi:surfactin synthase thioesterase subunit